jgi:hypothetical protein
MTCETWSSGDGSVGRWHGPLLHQDWLNEGKSHLAYSWVVDTDAWGYE